MCLVVLSSCYYKGFSLFSNAIYRERFNKKRQAISIIDVITQSQRLMHGHKWEYFCLQLSFIGWYLLVIMTCGIALIWVYPYIQTTNALYYRNLVKTMNEP